MPFETTATSAILHWLTGNRTRMVLCLLMLLIPLDGPATGQSAVSAPDQPGKFEPLSMAWTDIRPLFFTGSDGKPTGISVEFARELGKEVGFGINPFRIADFPAWGREQISGNSEILPMAAKLPALAESNHFSDVVFPSEVRLAVRVEESSTFDHVDLSGRRIGVLPPGAGSNPDLYPGAIIVPHPSTSAALVALLAGEIDALSTEAGFTFAEARAAKIDHRIAFVGPPLERLERVVVLHKSRSELLEPINEAIARMKADGRIDALRQAFQLRVPEVAPDTLSVPISHAPPWSVIDNNKITGFAPDFLRDLAARADLSISFEQISLSEYRASRREISNDLYPLILDNEENRTTLDLTLPVNILQLDILVRDEDIRFQSPDDLAEARIGVSGQAASVARSNMSDVGEIVTFDTPDALTNALSNGEVDAILLTALRLETKNVSSRFRSIGAPDFPLTLTIGLRPGLGVVRERLNGVIPGYVLSDDYTALVQKYFGAPVFWTRQRINLALGAAATVFLIMLGTLFWQRQRQRQVAFVNQQRELEREKAHSNTLARLVMELENSNREQAEFSYAISHDLKSPTNTMQMLINELQQEGSLSDDDLSILGDMKLTNTRMKQFVEDTLSYSRIIEDPKNVEAVDINGLIDGIIKDLASDIAEADARVTRLDMPPLKAHAIQMRSLFQNLIANAIKFRNPERSPVVEIGYEMLPDGIAITVTDNGIGIPEKYCARVFNMFNRLHTQSEYEGTGLGLTICRRVVTNHGGKIRAVSRPEGGTTFEATFPSSILV